MAYNKSIGAGDWAVQLEVWPYYYCPVVLAKTSGFSISGCYNLREGFAEVCVCVCAHAHCSQFAHLHDDLKEKKSLTMVT